MAQKHLKRLRVSRSWNIDVKANTFVMRPHPGMHTFKDGMAIATLLKEVLGTVHTTREVKHILNKVGVSVDMCRARIQNSW